MNFSNEKDQGSDAVAVISMVAEQHTFNNEEMTIRKPVQEDLLCKTVSGSQSPHALIE